MADINLVQGKTCSANNSVDPYLPEKAIDGTLKVSANRWLSYEVPGWLIVDLAAPYALSRWVACFLPSATDAVWAPNLYGMKKFSLQTSLDGQSWQTVDDVSNNTSSSTNRTFNPVAGRYVRFYADSGLNGNISGAISLLELEVYGHAISAELTSLVLSSGPLVPPFLPNATSYTQQVNADVASLTVTPTATDPTAKITVNGITVVSGQASAPIALATGSNTIQVLVTPLVGPAKTYTVNVTRAAAETPNLSSLKLQSGGVDYALAPAFSGTTGSYTASVPYSITDVNVIPVAQSSNAVITVNGTTVTSGSASGNIPLNVGSNTITVESTLPSGAKQTYTIAVTRAESAYLSSLVMKTGFYTYTLTPAFSPTVFSYTTATGAATRTSAILTLAAQSASATIKVNGTPVTSGTATVNFNPGSNTITVEVTNGSETKAYTIAVSLP